MALKGKGKAEGKSFRWDLEATMTLLNICLDYQKANGFDQPFSWLEICEELGQRIGKKCCHVSVKNKFDYMKTLWHLWKKLRHNETGIELVEGWIVADDAWWDKKIKENDKYKQFRKGVPPKIDDLWEQIFSAIVATGKHGGVAPSRDPLEADGSDTEAHFQRSTSADFESLSNYSEDEQLEADGGQGEAYSQFEADEDGNQAQNAQTEVCGPSASEPKAPTRSKFKKSKGGRISFQVLAKRKRNQSTRAVLYNPDLSPAGAMAPDGKGQKKGKSFQVEFDENEGTSYHMP